MEVISLQSGSNGNCFFIRSGETRLLIDAGISGRQAEMRLAQFGQRITDVTALLITHDHRDHVQGLGVFQRKFGFPVFVTEPTLDAACRYCRLGRLSNVHFFESGCNFEVGQVRIQTFRTPHDGVDGVGFVIEDDYFRLGVLTDLGHVFPGLPEVVRSLDGLVIESNYDEEMLANGHYPEPLKQRIRGPRGHLSNRDSAELLAEHGRHLQWACLAHLSEHNNRPDLAEREHIRALGSDFRVHVASRYSATGGMVLRPQATRPLCRTTN